MSKRKRKPVTLADFGGDHGTGTQAAKAGSKLEEMQNDDGANPNRMARRRRVLQSARWEKKLSMRQYQAAQTIEQAFARVEALGSGGDSVGRMMDLQQRVDASPKPDATVDIQTSTQGRLIFVMKPVPRSVRPVIEHMFWHNKPLGNFAQGRSFYDRTAEVKVALDLVANALGY